MNYAHPPRITFIDKQLGALMTEPEDSPFLLFIPIRRSAAHCQHCGPQVHNNLYAYI